MFDRIDDLLIKIVQWVVRQCELYTNITKKKIFGFCNETLKVFVFFNGIVVISIFYFERVGIVFILETILCTFFVFVYNAYHVLFDRMSDDDVRLQTEIHTRSGLRQSLILPGIGVCISLPMLIFEIIEILLDYGMYDALNSLLSFGIAFSALILLVLEYLLCTTSLPLSTRKQRSYERQRKSNIGS